MNARIPAEQLSRLSKFGDWLKQNGDAVYGTRPWIQAEAFTEDGEATLRFTRKDNNLYLMILDKLSGSTIKVKEVYIDGKACLLSDGSPINIERDGNDMVLTFARQLNDVFVPVVLIQILLSN